MPIPRNPHLVARSMKAMVAACVVACGASAANAQPNVVLFFIDDMGAADWEFDAQLNPTGSFVFETPNMLRLAEMGVTFSDGYAGAPVCSPSRGALMTGRSAASVGITDFIGAGSNASGNLVRTTNTWIQNIPSADVLLPEALAAAGYRTGFFGKWHLGQTGNPAADPLNAGFETNIAGVASGNPGFAGGFFAGSDGAWSGMPGLDTPGAFPPSKYLSDAISEEAADYVADRAAASEPFFMMMSHYVVPTPIEAPGALVTYYTNKIASLPPAEVAGHTDATYAAMVQKMDESLGRVLDALEDPDGNPATDDSIIDDTIIVFTADNGGLTNFAITDNRPYRAGKGSMYEGGIREPLIVAYPGSTRVNSNVVSGEVAIGYDIYPTILDLAGVAGDATQNANMDGVSLVPALESAGGRNAGLAARDVYWHYPHRSPQAITPSFPVDGGEWVSAVRRGSDKLLYFYDERRFERYDLSVDPGETNDIFANDPLESASMSLSLHGHLRRVDAPMPRDIGSEVELPGSAIVSEALVAPVDAQFTALFETTQDFAANGVGMTGWTGVLNPGLAAILDSNAGASGALAFRNAGFTRLVAGDIAAPVLYREVTGDFEATMRIASMEEANFHVLAMLVADPADVANEFFWVGQQNRAGANDFAQARDITGGVRQFDVGENGVYPYYRISRSDDTFTGFLSEDGLVWVPFVEFDRADMPETVWLGVFQSLFSDTAATAVVDDFQIITGCRADRADPVGIIDPRDVLDYLTFATPGTFFDVLAFLRAFDECCG